MGPSVDIAFSLSADGVIPSDHGYQLYAALSRVLPQLHKANGIGIHPLCGRQIGQRKLKLLRDTQLALRCGVQTVGELIQISGKTLKLAGAHLHIGVPRVIGLRPCAFLRSRLVTIKGYLERDSFLEAAQRQLQSLGLSAQAVPVLGKRRTLRIKEREIVGYELMVRNLTPEESLAVETHGVGGRRHMGCGIFAPWKNGEA
jgi:CRISPR-associated protein Cas6